MALDVQRIRQDFPILQQKIYNKPLVYLDNASTTQKPEQVINTVSRYYRESNANVHRSLYSLGEKATEAYESSRNKVAEFIHAPESRSIVFTRGTTESINLVAYAWGRHNLGPGDEILITEMEHHSNIVPWQLAARETGATLRYIPLLDDGTLDLSDPERYFTPQTKLFCIVHQSNVLGTINPIKALIRLARESGALSLIDGAQSVPHFPVDVQDLDCDFLAFSGHKMLGPTGVGVLYGRPELLETMEPFQGGGEMIQSVTMESSTWNSVPHKFEAGTPNIAQVVGLGAAIDYLQELGMDAIQDYEQSLTEFALECLGSLGEVTVYGPAGNRGSAISFNVGSIHPHDLAQFLDQDGIAVRAGHHCAQPVMQKLNVSSTTRASFYMYNTREEIEALCQGIGAIKQFFHGNF